MPSLPEPWREKSSPTQVPDTSGQEAALDVASLVSGLLHAGEFDIYRKVLLEVDRLVLDAVLRFVDGNQVQASELLGISRTTLRARIRSLAPGVEKQFPAAPDQHLPTRSGEPAH